MKLMRHVSINTTMEYYAVAEAEVVADEVCAAMPVANTNGAGRGVPVPVGGGGNIN